MERGERKAILRGEERAGEKRGRNKWREEETRRGEEKGIINKGRRKKDTDEAQTRNKTETDRHRQTDRQTDRTLRTPKSRDPKLLQACPPPWRPADVHVSERAASQISPSGSFEDCWCNVCQQSGAG